MPPALLEDRPLSSFDGTVVAARPPRMKVCRAPSSAIVAPNSPPKRNSESLSLSTRSKRQQGGSSAATLPQPELVAFYFGAKSSERAIVKRSSLAGRHAHRGRYDVLSRPGGGDRCPLRQGTYWRATRTTSGQRTSPMFSVLIRNRCPPPRLACQPLGLSRGRPVVPPPRPLAEDFGQTRMCPCCRSNTTACSYISPACSWRPARTRAPAMFTAVFGSALRLRAARAASRARPASSTAR
jgi:hypothetical protein